MNLSGKIIDFIGDSITEGHGVLNEANRYDNIIKRQCNLKAVYNYGIGGTRIAHQKKASENPHFDLCFCGRIYDINRDADIIIVFGGTNDYGHGDAPFGTMDDNTPDTYCGAVEWLMTYLKTEFPDKKVLFVTPARRLGDEELSVDDAKYVTGKTLDAYVDVIVKKGIEHNISVLSLFEKLGINPNVTEDRERYTTDGLHFNDEGHKKIANCIIEYLEEIL